MSSRKTFSNSRIHCSLAALTLLLLALGFAMPAAAEIKTQVVDYKSGEVELRGYLAWDDTVKGPRPGVLVIHEWWGHDEYARGRAEQLAEAGFTAFALDMYGTGRLADHPKDAQQFMEALLSDLPEAQRRFTAALKVLSGHPSVDAENTGAIGYCLGGGLALYMGRLDLGLDAVVSFHGSLQLAGMVPAEQLGSDPASMMVFTGGADPMAPADQVSSFVGAMMAAEVEVGLVSYPKAKHSFTVPAATERGRKTGMPLAYDADADADSWQRTTAFLSSRLGGSAAE